MNFAFEVERQGPPARREASRKTASNWYEPGSPGTWTNYVDFSDKPATTRGWVYDTSKAYGDTAEGLRERYGDAAWVWEVTNRGVVQESGTASSREEAQAAAEQAAQRLNATGSRKQAEGWPFRTKDPVTELNDIREQYPSGYDDAYAEGHELSNFFDRNGDPIVMHTKRYQMIGFPGSSYVVIGIQTRHSNTSLTGSDGGLILSEDGQSVDNVSRGRVGGQFNLIPKKEASLKHAEQDYPGRVMETPIGDTPRWQVVGPDGSTVDKTFNTREDAENYLKSLKESSMDRSDLNKREADILEAMANANLNERRQLADELNDVRRRKRAAIQQERDVDLADTVIRDTLTPVMAHSRSTEDTDWLGEVGLTSEAARDDVHRKMTAEATLWFRNLHEAVIADEEEFSEQAKGKARAVASSYDLIRDEATQAFLDQAVHLRRKAEVDWEGETGQGAADVSGTPTPGQEVADYPQPDTSSNTDDDFGDDDADKTGPKESAKTAGEEVEWSGELPDCDICKTEFTSSKPSKAEFDAKTAMGPWAYMCSTHFRALGVGLGTGQGQKLVKKQGEMNPPSDDLVDTDIDRYYGNPDGIEGPDSDSQSGYAETRAPEDWDEEPAFDDASFDEDPPKERANQATSPPPGESSRGNGFKPSYSRRKTAEEGQKWVAEVTGNGENRWSRNGLVFDTKEEAEQWLAGLKMRWFGYDMGRVVPADTPKDQSVSETGTEGIYQNFRSGSRKQAAEGDTCAVCGDSIARDDANENPSTWHHDNGEKHDHEAKPSDSSKESRLRARRVTAGYEVKKFSGGNKWGIWDTSEGTWYEGDESDAYYAAGVPYWTSESEARAAAERLGKTAESGLQVTDPERFKAFARNLRESQSQ